jgi:hypothetical protein
VRALVGRIAFLVGNCPSSPDLAEWAVALLALQSALRRDHHARCVRLRTAQPPGKPVDTAIR